MQDLIAGPATHTFISPSANPRRAVTVVSMVTQFYNFKSVNAVFVALHPQ